MASKILVTGSSGYVGSHTVKYLVQQGYRVMGVDEVPPSKPLQVYLSDYLVCDISDSRLVDFLLKNKVEGVVHCAAKCQVGESVQKPELYADYNVKRSKTFVNSLEQVEIPALVFSSTAAVYGEPAQIPIPEDHPKNPINPYGKTKLEFEEFLRKCEEKKKLRVGIFRYFNAAGCDPDSEIGEVHNPETHLIPNAILTALNQKKEFSIFGGDYKTRDGTCERDYVHVWDLAQAHTVLLHRLLNGHDGGTYNLGTSKGYTVKEVLDEVDQQAKTKIKRKLAPRRPGDPAILIANASKALKELNWKPTFSSLETIVETALRWHKRIVSPFFFV